ncbi:Polysaccharide deacetylase domain-containing protein [Cucumispora dikerogammari]|nr:Polysaccharide deacetylase domain-containing protein [Cucumispora dikerogammari]
MFLFSLHSEIFTVVLPDKCTVGGKIALTFDDGPTGATPEILNILNDREIPATFHFVTQNISRPNIQALVIETAESDNEVGIRVSPQRNYDDMDPEEIKEDIENQVSVLSSVVGSDTIKFARAPIEDGITNPYVYEALKDQDLIQTGYSNCMYHEATNTEELENTLKLLFASSNVKYDSFIFLLHEQKELEFPTLETIIDLGLENGYTFVTLSDCLEGYEPGNLITRNGVISNRKKSSSTMFVSELTNLAMLLLCG